MQRVFTVVAAGRGLGQQEAPQHDRSEDQRLARDGHRRVRTGLGGAVRADRQHIDVLEHAQQDQGAQRGADLDGQPVRCRHGRVGGGHGVGGRVGGRLSADGAGAEDRVPVPEPDQYTEQDRQAGATGTQARQHKPDREGTSGQALQQEVDREAGVPVGGLQQPAVYAEQAPGGARGEHFGDTAGTR